MTAPRIAKSNLGEVEGRLRRSLGLAGLLAPDLHPESLFPVVIADDATRPGTSTDRNRRWGTYRPLSSIAGGATPAYYRVALAPLVIDVVQLVCVSTTGGSVTVGMFMGDQSAGTGAAGLITVAPFLERFNGAGDFAPLSHGTDNAGILPAYTKFMDFTFNAVGQQYTVAVPGGWAFLDTNQKLANLAVSTGGNHTVNVMTLGRTF